jgi:Fe-S-cluster containining protein
MTALSKVNLSKQIIPEIDCKNCGKCCESFEIWYDDSCEEVQKSEIRRFMMLAEIGKKITTRKETLTDGKKTTSGVWLIFNYPCKYLTSEKRCLIYTSSFRPLLCRLYPYSGTTKDDCPKVRS